LNFEFTKNKKNCMKKTLSLLILCFCLSYLNSQTLTSGNIVVLRVGDSSATLANTGNTLALDQFTTAGTYVNSVIIPKTGSNAVCLSGTATSEGSLSLAGNRSSVVFFAYRTAAPFTSSISATTSAAVNRAVVSINSAGVVSIPTSTASLLSANNPRHVFTNGTSYWGGGGNTGIISGNSSINMDTIVTSTTTNTRFISSSGSQLYYSTASGTFGIWKLGNGAPTNSGNVATLYIATPSGSPYGFAMRFDSTVCYIADDRAVASGGGIQKWTRSGSTWTLAYTIGTGTGSTVGARGLAVNWTTIPPTIFATTAEATLNRVIRINDTSSTVTPITIATSVSNTIFRGVSFTPGTTTMPVVLTSFNGKIENQLVNLNWSTSSEKNNKGFVIERSIDGVDYENIAFVKGSGNSNKVMNYSYSDENVNAEVVYYRLKQIDFDGQFEYSKVLTIKNDELSIIVTPNPFEGQISINGTSPDELISIDLMDISGKVKLTESNNGSVVIDTRGLAQGIYFIRINNGEKVIVKRIIKN